MKTSLSLAAVIAACMGTAQVQAYEAGDVIVKAGATMVAAKGDSSNVSVGALGGAQAGSGVDVDDDTQLGLTITYMLDSNWGIELLAATPFTHDVKTDGSLAAVGKVAEVTQLPPTLSALYYFNNESNITPYVGVGVNYTIFFEEDGKGAFADSKVELDNSFGLAAQIGVDVQLSDELLLNASVRYIDIDTDAKLSGGALGTTTVGVDIDPMVYSIMLGYKF